jgi:hypothetical protein
VLHRSNGSYAISNISLRWMIREIVAAGHHDLFRDDAHMQEFFPRITIPKPSTAQDAGMEENFSDLLDIDDLKQGMKK